MADYNDLDEFGFEEEGPQDEFSEFGFEEYIEPSQEDANKMGVGEAVATGIGQGATFGLSPILSGIMGAGTEAVEDIADIAGLTTDSELRDQGFQIEDDYKGLEGLMDAYYEARDRKKAQEEKAFEDQTTAFMGGNVLGGLGTTMLTGGLAGAGKAGQVASKILPKAENLKNAKLVDKVGVGVREGIKAGTLAGFGQGEGKLIEAPLDTIEEVAKSAAIGGTFGGLLPVLARGAEKGKDFIKNIPLFKSIGLGYKAGKEGVDIADDHQVVDYISGITKDIRDSISKNFKGSSKRELLEQADEIGIRVNAGEAIEDVINDIKETGTFGAKDQKELSQFIDDLRNMSKSTELHPSLSKGEVPIKQYDLENLKLSETDEILKKIGNKAYPEGSGDASTNYARDVYARLRELSNEATESSTLPEKNKKLKALFDGLESLGIKSKDFFSKQEVVRDRVEKKIQQKLTSSPLSSSDSDMRNFLKYLGRADEELSEEIAGKSKFASDLSKFVRQSEGEGSVSLKSAAGPVQKIVAKGGNIFGSLNKSGRDFSSDFYNKMIDMTPDNAVKFGEELASQFGDKATPYVNQLVKAAGSPAQRKNALMYGIYQQPAFRKMLERMGRTIRTIIDEEDDQK